MSGSHVPGRIPYHPVRFHEANTLGTSSLLYRGHATKRHSKPSRRLPTAGRIAVPSQQCRANVLRVSATVLGGYLPVSERTEHAAVGVCPRYSSELDSSPIGYLYKPFCPPEAIYAEVPASVVQSTAWRYCFEASEVWLSSLAVVWLSDGTGTLSEMPLEHIKIRSFRQKFQHGEVAAVILPVVGRFNRVVAVDQRQRQLTFDP
jgi:hypothetical protein